MKDYTILTDESRVELEIAVHELLAKGWQLQGGVSVAAVSTTFENQDGPHTVETWLYAQAMTK